MRCKNTTEIVEESAWSDSLLIPYDFAWWVPSELIHKHQTEKLCKEKIADLKFAMQFLKNDRDKEFYQKILS
jgi:hypothetical protein